MAHAGAPVLFFARTLDVFAKASSGVEVPLTVSRTAPTVTGLKAARLRSSGILGTALVDLPVTAPKVVAELRAATVAAVSPDQAGYASTWRITFIKGVACGRRFALKLKAAGSGITDRIANRLMADSQTLIAC